MNPKQARKSFLVHRQKTLEKPSDYKLTDGRTHKATSIVASSRLKILLDPTKRDELMFKNFDSLFERARKSSSFISANLAPNPFSLSLIIKGSAGKKNKGGGGEKGGAGGGGGGGGGGDKHMLAPGGGDTPLGGAETPLGGKKLVDDKTWAFTGYDVGDKIIHASGFTSRLIAVVVVGLRIFVVLRIRAGTGASVDTLPAATCCHGLRHG